MSRRRRLPSLRPTLTPSRALLVFSAAIALALVASVVVLWPDAATQIADGLAQAPRHLEQWLPAGLLD